MALARWLRSALAPRPVARKAPPPRRLSVECLEDRTTPAGGALDPTFGTGGVVFGNFASYARLTEVAVLSDGKIIAAGHVGGVNSRSDFAVARYNPDGTPDSGFGSGGLSVVDFARSEDQAKAVAVQPGSGGKLLVAGYATTSFGQSFGVVRLNPNGTLDTTFGTKTDKGKVAIKIGGRQGGFNYCYDMAILPDGKFVLAGQTKDAPLGIGPLTLARFNANGTFDTSFGSGGMVLTTIAATGTTGTPSLERPVKVAVDAAGRVVVSAITAGANSDFLVARFTPGGSLDTTFGTAGTGVVTTDLRGGVDQANGLALDGAGNIVVAGNMGPQPNTSQSALATVVRYKPNGTLDASFGQGGVAAAAWHPDDPSEAGGRDVAIQADGRILVVGAGRYDTSPGDGAFDPSDPELLVMRFNSDGSADTSYGSLGTGATSTAFRGTHSSAWAVALQPDGRAVVAGRWEDSLLFADGVVVARFLPSGPQIGSFVGSPGPVTAGDPVTLTAANISSGNTGATVTQVAFYADGNGDGKLDAADILLGYGTPVNGTWSLMVSTTGWAAGMYTLFARATDSYGALGDPISLSLQVV